MKRILLPAFILAFRVIGAQNLVINPSFEDTLQCPDFVSEINYATNWQVCNLTPDYYNACNNTSQTNPGMVGVPDNARGYQPARTGNAYAGVVIYYTSQTNYREAFQAQLSQPLQQGVTYQVGMWVILNEDNAQWAVDGGLGIYLSCTPINTSQYFSYTPQIVNPNGNVLNDTLNWTLISGTYTANGGEQYITIGGFLPDNLITTFTRPGGSYNFTSYAIDDVYVIDNLSTSVNDAINDVNALVYPNPAADEVTITVPKTGIEEMTVEVTDLLGQRVYFSEGSSGNMKISLNGLAKGVYNVRITADNCVFNKKITKE